VDVVGVGLNATDTIIRLSHFPSFNTKVQFESAQVSAGGQTASAVVACATWGLRARYVGKVGDDAAAALQRTEFERAGVEAQLIAVSDCSSQQAFILVDRTTGERTILWRRDDRLALQPGDLRREWITSARALHVDGHDNLAAAQAARWAREAGIPVTADVDNLYLHIQALLENVDYLIASHEFPARLTGENDLLKSLPAIAQRHGCKVTGATLGRDGALLWTREHGFLYAPAYQVEARDTTGAGDIFHGAFLYGLLAAWPLPRILDFSCAAAGLNCTAFGARGGIKPIAAIEHLRQSSPKHPAPTTLARYSVLTS
jgi:sugar/nucleoside kinase (ribokinase family)